MKVVVPFLSIAVLLTCLNNTQAQDFLHKVGPILKTFTSNNITAQGHMNLHKKIGAPNSTQSLHEVLASNGYYTTSYALAPQGVSRYERTVYLITAAELATAGIPNQSNFTSLGFEYDAPQSITTSGAFKVYFQNTTDVANGKVSSWATDISTMTLVDNSSDVIPVDYIFNHTLSNPTAFKYTGGGLYIAWEYSGANTTYSTASEVAVTTVLTSRTAMSTSSLPGTVASIAARPATILGYNVGTDVAVTGVYTLGLLPLGQGLPHFVQATIYNGGDVAVTSLPCTLSVSGSNTFSDIQTVSSLSVGYYTQVRFNAFNPTTVGSDVLTVTIPSDAIVSNNTLTVSHTVGANTDPSKMAYSDGTTTYAGGLGTGGTTEYSFVSKFYINGNASLNSTRIFIYGGTGKTVKGIAYDKSGNIIAQSPAHVLVTADTLNYVTLTFPAPPAIYNDSVYIGLNVPAAASTFYPLGLQTENWMRQGAFFYYTASTGFEDLGGNNYGIFMIEASLSPIPTPVELTSFTSNISNGKVNLSWTTATEQNNNGFQVERSSMDNCSWASIGFIKGAGSSNSPKHYSFIDNSVLNGKYNYRLKQIDNDGKYKYSNLVTANVNVPGIFSLSQNYPNPFNPSTRIDYTLPVDSKVKIELYNITGQKAADLVNNDQSAGFYSLNVNANLLKNITSGVYIYKMTAIEKTTGKNFISSRKLILMK
jgi:hypothetical protein